PSEEGLDEHGADGALPQRRLDGGERFVEVGVRGRVGGEASMGVELGGERGAVARPQTERAERAIPEAVVGALEGEDPGATRRQRRRLQGGADGVRATLPEDALGVSPGEVLAEAGEQADLRVARVD